MARDTCLCPLLKIGKSERRQTGIILSGNLIVKKKVSTPSMKILALRHHTFLTAPTVH